jgi:ammonium transporter, Amt family
MLVYVPVTHWVWGDGWLMKRSVMDFAGGLTVHATAGASSLVIAALLGPRDGFPKQLQPPHNPGMTMMGAGMLWVGWFGFNGGSALTADGAAGMAIVATHLSAATAGLVWMLIEYLRFGRASMVGAVTGVIAGLATVTPASGFIGPIGGVILGASGALVCFVAVDIIKHKIRIDDSLDVFAVHGVGGILGTFLVAFLAHESMGGAGYAKGVTMQDQVITQAIGIGATVLWSVVMTALIVLAAKALVGLRVDAETQHEGLDSASHGERGYSLNN